MLTDFLQLQQKKNLSQLTAFNRHWENFYIGFMSFNFRF